MKKTILKMAFFAFAALAAAALCISAAAEEFVYSFDDSTLIDGIEADTYAVDGKEITIEKELRDGEEDPGMSVRCLLFNEYIDPEFWNDPNVTVSIDVRLDTEGANVIGYIIGFDSKWTWINPSAFTVLKYNEWITITETGAHFYEYFKANEPNRLLFQTRSNWGAGSQGSVKVTAKNFRISDGASPAVPTEESAPQTTTTAAATGTDTPASSPAPDTSPDTPDTPAPAVTSIQTASAASTSINYADVDLNVGEHTEKTTALVFIVIIVVAVVVVAGIVVGYLIYKKKKYY